MCKLCIPSSFSNQEEYFSNSPQSLVEAKMLRKGGSTSESKTAEDVSTFLSIGYHPSEYLRYSGGHSILFSKSNRNRIVPIPLPSELGEKAWTLPCQHPSISLVPLFLLMKIVEVSSTRFTTRRLS